MENNYRFNQCWNLFQKWHRNRIEMHCIELALPIKDYMEYPIEWNRSMPLFQYLQQIFKLYQQEVKSWLNENRKTDCIIDIEKIQNVCNLIIGIIKEEMLIDIPILPRADGCSNKMIDLWNLLCLENYVSNESLKGKEFFRLRKGQGLFSEVDFYHTPYDKFYLCGSCRFTPAGVPSLYLGYSKEVCMREVSSHDATIAKFKGISDYEFSIMDLTFRNQQKEIGNEMFYLWPILAACYVAVPRDEDVNCVNYKEEYVFPQALMKYVVCTKRIDGVKYYTCRNKNLNPAKNTDCNLALFAHYGKYNYDMDLMNKFAISDIHNI